jgi:hypothetical protein
MQNQIEIPSYLLLLISGNFLKPLSWGDSEKSNLLWEIDPMIVLFLGDNVKTICFSLDLEMNVCNFTLRFYGGAHSSSEWIAVPPNLQEFKEQLAALK